MKKLPKSPARSRAFTPATVLGLALLVGISAVSAEVYPTRTKGGTKVRIYEQKP